MGISSAGSVLLSPVTGCIQEASEEAIYLSPERGEERGDRRQLEMSITGDFSSSWKCHQRNMEHSHPQGKVNGGSCPWPWGVVPGRDENLLYRISDKPLFLLLIWSWIGIKFYSPCLRNALSNPSVDSRLALIYI